MPSTSGGWPFPLREGPFPWLLSQRRGGGSEIHTLSPCLMLKEGPLPPMPLAVLLTVRLRVRLCVRVMRSKLWDSDVGC